MHKLLNINTKHKRHQHMHFPALRKRLFRLAGKPIWWCDKARSGLQNGHNRST